MTDEMDDQNRLDHAIGSRMGRDRVFSIDSAMEDDEPTNPLDQEDFDGHWKKRTQEWIDSGKQAAPESSPDEEKKKRTYTCSVCGGAGHTKATCKKEISPPPEPPGSRKKKRTYKCGLCGEEGHTKATCKKRISPPSEPSGSRRKKGTYKCSNCGFEQRWIKTHE